MAAQRTETVGALFAIDSRGTLGTHFCTGTVVDSPTGDVIATAAHCLAGEKAGSFAFVPGYRNGAAPLGIWIVKKIVVDSAWTRFADPDHDFALLIVQRTGSSASLEALTGGEHIRVIKANGKRATVVGYPASTASAITCTNLVRALTPTQLEFDCEGYTNGTSGSALVVNADSATGLGTVVGVIGGYELGGQTAAVSYAATFNASALALYHRATSTS